MMVFRFVLTTLLLLASFVCVVAQEQPEQKTLTEEKKTKIEFEYKLLATNRTTTMEKEMNDAAAEGYRFLEVISGETFFGGSEALVVMVRPAEEFSRGRFAYRLLATTKTATMQKELQAAGDEGYEHRGQSVFKKTFGTEVMVILERDNKIKTKAVGLQTAGDKEDVDDAEGSNGSRGGGLSVRRVLDRFDVLRRQ